jgi:CBS domain-containing protein
MSLHDQEAFLKSIHPFELLNSKELTKAVNSMNIAYYKKDTVLISPLQSSKFLYIIVKGEVGEYHKEELTKVYNTSNTFDADSLIYDNTTDSFVVLEELICFEMKKEDFKSLLESNEKFKHFYISDLANKIQSAKNKEYTTQMSGFMIARVSDSYIHRACIVKEDETIMDALGDMESKKTNCILVKNSNDEYGIVTDSILRHHILYKNYSKFGPIGPIALRPVITIDYDDFLFNALLSFTKNSIKRIVVLKNGKVFGVLEQLDLLSYFANHTYLVSVQIKKATTLEELKLASRDFLNIIKKLHAKGTKVEYIAQLISELNEKIYEKLYEMIVPSRLKKHACLIVMGSEGRKEQMLKTDQDNALIIEDGVDASQYEECMMKFTNTLIDFGFPRCTGNIMVSNQYWRKSKKEFKNEIDRWLESPSGDDYMHLAIFFDSIVVAGNKNLHGELKNTIFEQAKDKTVFMANFAKAALLFETPIGMFTNLISKDNKIDVKKGGIFAIVQGIRSLALEYGIKETNTNLRIRELKKLKALEPEFADILEESFDTILNLRLKERLKNFNHEEDPNNFIDIGHLNKLESDLLKDSFKIVNKFKDFLSHHFMLSMIG